MRKIPTCHDVPGADEPTLALPDTVDLIGVTVTRIRALLQEGRLIAVHRDGTAQVPARFFKDNEVVCFVLGALALPANGGYTREETLEQLFTEDESLSGRPMDVLHGHLVREIIYRVQATAL